MSETDSGPDPKSGHEPTTNTRNLAGKRHRDSTVELRVDYFERRVGTD